MRIAIFSDTYRPMVSGVVTSQDNLSKYLAERGHTVKVFGVLGEKRAPPPKGVQLDLTRGMTMPTYEGLRIATPSSIGLLLKIRKFKPDVIHSMTPFGMGSQAMIISKALNIPLVYTEHTIYPDFVKHISIKDVKGINNKIDMMLKAVTALPLNFLSIYTSFLIAYYKTLVNLNMNRVLKESEKIKIRKTIKNQLITFKDFGKNLISLIKKEQRHKLKPKNIAKSIKAVSAKQYSKLLWRYFLYFYNQADVLTTPSEAMRKVMKLQGAKPRIIAISNGIDRKRFKPMKVKKDKGIKIVHVGRVAFEKNIDVTIKAVAEVIKRNKNVSFDICGGGPQLEEMKKLVKKIGMQRKIKFLGMIDHKVINKHYLKAHIFVTASTIETEGLVMVEAMGCGLPVVAVNALACPYVVMHNQNGFIARPGDHMQMAEYIEKLVKDKKLLNKMSKASLKLAEDFDVQNIVDRWEIIYAKLSENYKLKNGKKKKSKKTKRKKVKKRR